MKVQVPLNPTPPLADTLMVWDPISSSATTVNRSELPLLMVLERPLMVMSVSWCCPVAPGSSVVAKAPIQEELPAELRALTRNSYRVPGCSPVTIL